MTLIETIRLYLGYAGNLQEKVVHHWRKNMSPCGAGILIIVMPVFVKGPRVGWILAAEHPFAVSINPVSALQWSHSHSAPGEGCSHSSCHIHTHTGLNTFWLRKTTDVLTYSVLAMHILTFSGYHWFNLYFIFLFPNHTGPLWFYGTPGHGQTHRKPISYQAVRLNFEAVISLQNSTHRTYGIFMWLLSVVDKTKWCIFLYHV